VRRVHHLGGIRDPANKRFLTAWNDGHFTKSSDGKQISTYRAIFMLTSNAASDELMDIWAALAVANGGA